MKNDDWMDDRWGKEQGRQWLWEKRGKQWQEGWKIQTREKGKEQVMRKKRRRRRRWQKECKKNAEDRNERKHNMLTVRQKKHKRWMSRKEIRVEKEKKTWLNGNGKIMRSRERAAVGEEWPCTLKVDSRNLYLSSVWNLPGYFVNIQQTVREVNCFASHWSELH